MNDIQTANALNLVGVTFAWVVALAGSSMIAMLVVWALGSLVKELKR